MALVLADRVLETTTSTGSGTITLAGAEPGYQSFAVVGNTNQTYYTIAGDTEWEVGIGTYTSSGTTFSRDTVLSSSDSGNKVTFSAGVKKVFVTYPSEKSVNRDVSGNISASSAIITNLADPVIGSDAANKAYVDNVTSAALHVHEQVVLATPANSGRNDTYNNGTAGVSATLTATANGTLVIDSTVAQAAQRVLIKDCDDQVENGIYVVTTVGDGSNPYVMTRSSDADTSGESNAFTLDEGSYFFVTGGTTQKGAAYVCNTSTLIIFGTTSITFAEFSQAQVYSAGNGISITLGSIALNTPVTVASGGTGLTTSPANGQLLIGNGSNYTLSTLTAGSGVSITNSAGSITLSATGLGGTVTAVTATGPLASSGGATPDISIANSTGTGSVVLDQGATISSATITAAVSASITTITGTSANITTVSGTTARFSSAAITQLSGTSAGITTVSGTTATFSSGTITQFGATSATIASVSGTNVTYSNGSFTSATVTTISGTTATYTSATITTVTGNLIGNASTATTAANVNNGTLTMNVSGTGLSGSQTFTANQSSNATFTVTSNATSANTLSTIVARDSSTGGFTAGDITAQRPAALTTGVIFLGNTGTRYLFFDGTNYVMPASNLFVNGSQAVTNNGGNWNINAVGIYSTQPTIGYVISGQSIAYTSQLGPQILGQGGSAAAITFHRPGAYAINLGLDTDNVVKIGGWSAGAVAYPILTSNNYTSYISGSSLKSQTFTGSGTFTVPTGITSVWVTIIGGGGGGGGSSVGAGGGGSGAFAYKRAVSVTPGAGVTVTIGGGAGGGTNNVGGDGSASSFGSITVSGGNGGRISTQLSFGGAGGSSGGSGSGQNNLSIPAQIAEGSLLGGRGGLSRGSSYMWGGGGGGFLDGANCNDSGVGSSASANSGSGGGAGNSVGGSGGSGMCIVEWLA